MEISNEERKVFSEIQKRLFYMIPQKWESVYLYASVSQESFRKSQGEMFFYYYPKGILKKNPINVYEIPGLFNIDEETYNELINGLFLDIRKLYDIAIEKHPVIWTSITIIIEGSIFKIEYNYDDLEKKEDFDYYERHVIWRNQYLDLDYNTLSKKEKGIIDRYNNSIYLNRGKKDVYTEGMYKQVSHNIIDYAKTVSLDTVLALQQSDDRKKNKELGKDILTRFKKKKSQPKDNENIDEIQDTNNQILSMNVNNNKDDFDIEDMVLTSDEMKKGHVKKEVKDNSDDDSFDIEDGLLTSEVMTKRKNK